MQPKTNDMKKLHFLIIFCALHFGVCLGQDELKAGDLINFSSPVSHTSSDHAKKDFLLTQSKEVNYLEPQFIYTYLGCENDECYVTALPFSSGPDIKNGLDRREYYNDKVFTISKSQFISKLKPFDNAIGKLTIGVLTLPFRIRLQDEWSFETTFNLGVTAGIHIKRNIFLQLGTQIGSSEISSSNADIEDGKSITASTLSLVSGIMYEYKKAQIGIYLGADLINNQSEYDWIHHGKPWISLGIGYDIYKIGQPKKN